MPEVRACDVPGRWRVFLYMGALCGCSNVYQCCWLPKWLRYLSIVYQIIMMSTYIIAIGVALAGSGSGLSFDLAFNRYAKLFCGIIITLSNIVYLWQTCCGSGLSVLFQTQKAFREGNSCRAKHKVWLDCIILIVCLFVIVCELVLISVYVRFTTHAQKMYASYAFPVLSDHAAQKLFWIYIIMQVSALTFICSYTLLCFLVMVDITFLFRTLREELGGVLSVPVVDEAALERCLHTFNGICELVEAANGTFGVLLAIYLMWILPFIINVGLQLALKQEVDLTLHLSSFACASVILALILVPPSVMTAMVKCIPFATKYYIHCQ